MTRYHRPDKVVQRLRSHGETQEQLAEKFELSQSNISRVLSGKIGLTDKLLKALGYDPVPYYRLEKD